MYSILIVDDEEPVLDSYSYLIKTETTEFTLCGKARTGNDALAMIMQHKPDVVFMDISMPGLDGIEVIERVHPSFPDTIFVLSTAFERFDIARRAVPLGVFAYLVKPVSKKTFVQTMQDILQTLQKRTMTPELIQKQRADFFATTMHHPIDEATWEQVCELFHFAHEHFCVVMAHCPEKYRSELVKRLSFKYNVYESSYLSFLQLLVPVAPQADACIVHDVEAIAKEIVPPSEVFAVSQGEITDGMNLYKSCAAALRSLRATLDTNAVYEQSLIADFRRSFAENQSSALGESDTAQTDCAAAVDSCTCLVRYLFSAHDFFPALSTLYGAFMLVLDDLFHQYGSRCTEKGPFDVAASLLTLTNQDEVLSRATSAVDLIISEYTAQKSIHFPPPLTKALDVIEKEYAKPLQLGDVASSAGVSEPYLSRLFSAFLRTGFSDYLTSVRITKAKELLRTDANIKEVAFAVGFQDQNYFSRIFRKVTGQTPSSFKGE